MSPRRLLILVGLCASAVLMHAQLVITGYSQTGSLAANDDDHSGYYNSAGENLGFSINFGGTNYSTVFVSNNGYLTFGSGSYDYSPYALDANYISHASPGLPIIAAFFADVDTRAIGTVTWGTANVNGHAAFVAKWDGVGQYSYGTSPNTFEIVLIQRSDLGAGAFDVQFVYKTITWDYYGDVVAGFHNGNATAPQYYQLPGSLTSGAFLDGGTNSLTSLTNSNSSGLYLLESVNGSFLTPAAVVPEPSTVALLASGAGLLGLVTLFRRRKSE